MNVKRFSMCRLYLSFVGLMVGFVLIGMRHLYLAVDQQPFLLEKSHDRTERQITFLAHKGMVVDRHQRPLAISKSYYRLGINPHKFDMNEQDIGQLANIIGVKLQALQSQIHQAEQKRFLLLANHLDYHQMNALKKLPLDQLIIEEKKGRHYPLGEMAAPLIGYVGQDGNGKLGLEYQFNNYIDGHDGQMSYTKNLLNQVTSVHDYQPQVSGKNLQLTLDARLQQMAYQYLKEAVEHHKAEHASCLVTNPKTGEILAMVNYPSFDPNQPLTKMGDETINHPVADLIEPGSIIKPIAMAAVLQEQAHDPQEIMDVSGSYALEGWDFHDHKDLGQIHFEEIFEKSSNIAMVKLVETLPNNALLRTYHRFGLFSPGFVQLPGETVGRHVPSPSLIDQAAMSYGYGLSVSMLSLIRGYNIIANHGLDAGLHLVKEKHRPDSEAIISSEVAEQIKDMMVLVTERGAASYRAKVGQIKVAGKSGTAHHINDQGDYVNQYTASFAGFAPAEDPQVSIIVVVDRPNQHGHYGGQVAAPLFAKLLNSALNYIID